MDRYILFFLVLVLASALVFARGFDPSEGFYLGSLPAYVEVSRAEALVYVLEGGEVGVHVFNGYSLPVEVNASVEDVEFRAVVGPGETATFGPVKAEATGVARVSVAVRVLYGEPEPNLAVEARVSVAGGSVWRAAAVYLFAGLAFMAPVAAAARRVLYPRGLWVSLQPALLLAAATGLVAAASRVAERAAPAFAVVEPAGNPCLLDAALVPLDLVQLDSDLAILAVFAGALAAPVSLDYSMQQYHSMRASYSLPRFIIGVASVFVMLVASLLAVALAAIAATGGLDLAVRLWPVTINDAYNSLPLLAGLALSAWLAVFSASSLAFAARRPLTVALALTVALLVAPGTLFRVTYRGCRDVIVVFEGNPGWLLAAGSAAGAAALAYYWLRR